LIHPCTLQTLTLPFGTLQLDFVADIFRLSCTFWFKYSLDDNSILWYQADLMMETEGGHGNSGRNRCNPVELQSSQRVVDDSIQKSTVGNKSVYRKGHFYRNLFKAMSGKRCQRIS
jgi:hypothetical protein